MGTSLRSVCPSGWLFGMFSLIAHFFRSGGGVLSTMLGLVDSNTHPFGNGYSSSNPWQVNSFHPDGWSNSLGAEASAITDRVHGPYPPNTPSSCDLPAYPHSCTVDLCPC